MHHVNTTTGRFPGNKKSFRAMTTNKKLQKIAEKYSALTYNSDNYEIGGGLDNCKFASRRHEDARNDEGKLTLGQANAMFAKATGLSTGEIKEIIEFHFENLEWHHAGKLPKAYGGGMKKTYFVNAGQIVELAQNFETIQNKYNLDVAAKLDYAAAQKSLETRLLEYLQNHATKVVRVAYSTFKEKYYITIGREMNGKYGWFESQSRYNLPEYITAWVFSSETEYNEYFNIK